MSVGPHVSISAETVSTIAGLPINNSMVSSAIVSFVIIAIAVAVKLSLRKTSRPTGLQNVAEAFVEGFYNLIYSVTQSKQKTRQFFPVLATFFLFILLNNWFGLLPIVGTVGTYHQEAAVVQGKNESSNSESASNAKIASEEPVLDSEGHDTTLAESTTAKVTSEHLPATTESSNIVRAKVFVPLLRAATADLNLTLALGLISVICVQFFGVAYLHLGYFSKFFNFSSPLGFIIGILELVLECAKVVSFAFRLFGNIFAGEVLLVVISFLIPVVAPMPFYGLEVFVGLIQALVFAMLSLVFMNMATISHNEH